MPNHEVIATRYCRHWSMHGLRWKRARHKGGANMSAMTVMSSAWIALELPLQGRWSCANTDSVWKMCANEHGHCSKGNMPDLLKNSRGSPKLISAVWPKWRCSKIRHKKTYEY